MPESSSFHKSMLLRGVRLPKPVLDDADRSQTRSKAARSGRSQGGAPLRNSYDGNGRGRGRGRGAINYNAGPPRDQYNPNSNFNTNFAQNNMNFPPPPPPDVLARMGIPPPFPPIPPPGLNGAYPPGPPPFFPPPGVRDQFGNFRPPPPPPNYRNDRSYGYREDRDHRGGYGSRDNWRNDRRY
jgi:5'-3' exoribonuclease 2